MKLIARWLEPALGAREDEIRHLRHVVSAQQAQITLLIKALAEQQTPGVLNRVNAPERGAMLLQKEPIQRDEREAEEPVTMAYPFLG